MVHVILILGFQAAATGELAEIEEPRVVDFYAIGRLPVQDAAGGGLRSGTPRQRLPEQSLSIELADVTVRIDAETAAWARDEARKSGQPHNDARALFIDVITWVLTERGIARLGRGWLTREDVINTLPLPKLMKELKKKRGVG